MKRIAAILVLSVLIGATASAGKKTPSSKPAAARAKADAAKTRAAKARRARKILAYHSRSIHLAARGKFAQAEPLLKKLLDLDPTDSTAWYNMACVHSRLGRPKKALASLDKALEHGYADIRHMQRDPDMAPLRKLGGYKAVIARNAEIQRKRAEKVRREMAETFGEGHIIEIDHASKLVFATNVDRHTLEQLRGHLTAYANAQWAGLFTHRFEQYVTVVVPSADDKRFRRRGVGGYYMHSSRRLVARQVGMVMTHEFTHALHAADLDGFGQRHPAWVQEGFATLFESSRVASGCAVPLPNHRLTLLKRLLARKKTIAFEEFFKQSHRDFMRSAMVGYPQTRYIMMYLHDKGVLKKWYDAFIAGFEADKTGARALETVLDKPIDEIEADWKEWVRLQESPPTRLRPGSAYVGVRTRGRIAGLEIAEVVAGSGAAEAGLKRGDVIVGIDGERMIDPAALLQLVMSHSPGDKIEVAFRRDGKYDAATVTLGSWRRPARAKPKPKPATQPAKRRPTTRPARKKAA